MSESAGAGFVDELEQVVARGLTADSYEGDLVTELCFDLCDRRALGST